MPTKRPLEADPDPYAEIAALTAEVERLQDELTGLKASLGFYWVPPLELCLTGSEGKVLARLLKGDLVTKDQFMVYLYNLNLDEPEIKIIDVFICKLRKKLKPFDLVIATRWGHGYQMPRESIERFTSQWPLPPKERP